MIALVRHIKHERYSPRLYIIANTDDLSEVKARKVEQDRSAIEGKDVRYGNDFTTDMA